MRSNFSALRRRIEKIERQQASERRGDLERRIEAQLDTVPVASMATGDLPAALSADLGELRAMLSPAELATARNLRDAVLAAVAFGGVP
jgi:uncharacterized membrane protein